MFEQALVPTVCLWRLAEVCRRHSCVLLIELWRKSWPGYLFSKYLLAIPKAQKDRLLPQEAKSSSEDS